MANKLIGEIYEYREDKLLGIGSFGKVYEGRSIVDNKIVAIKRVDCLDNENNMKVLRELELMRARDHQNVMNYLVAIREEPYLFIIMKKCEGNLQELLDKFGGRLENKDNIQGAVSQITAGYEALYHAKILHRDIKPQNILYILNNSNQATLMLADLGCGRILDSQYAYTDVGNLAYMAPEVYDIHSGKGGHYDSRADLWSLGLVFCQIASGLILSHKQELLSNVPKELFQICIKILVLQEQRIQPEVLFKNEYIRSGSGIPIQLNLEEIQAHNNSTVSKKEPFIGSLTSLREKLNNMAIENAEGNLTVIEKLKEQETIKTNRVEQAMLFIDRGYFVSESPYNTMIRPSIGFNTTISSFNTVAVALELLKDHLVPGSNALDVGSGSGYLTACMAAMVTETGKVTGIEHIPELVAQAIKNIQQSKTNLLKYDRLSFAVADGRLGYPKNAPYQAIFVGAASPFVPETLIKQLAPGGRMIIPIVTEDNKQLLRQIDKMVSGELEIRDLITSHFEPLTDKEKQLSDKHHWHSY